MSTKKKTEKEKNNNNNLFPVTADLTELANKFYDEAMSPSLNGLKFCIEFLTCRVKPYMYSKIKESRYRIKEIDKELAIKYNNIPDENKTEPRVSILGPAVDVLKYNLEEEQVRNMFINILTSEMDNRIQHKVLPAYTKIIEQLSIDDAKFLSELKEWENVQQVRSWQIFKYKIVYNEINRHKDFKLILYFDNEEMIELDPIIIDNLERLNIIEKELVLGLRRIELKNEKIRDIKEKYKLNLKENEGLDYNRYILTVTNFGQQFIDICCS
ncbi:MAG: DUF4393 domain-containing protein [Bacilli bacterium]|nr:DUF4393 domain-containing protein [Bacilli bacterium]